MRRENGRTAGVVLNAVDLGRHEYGQYHYYYYKRDGGYAPLEGSASSETPSAS